MRKRGEKGPRGGLSWVLPKKCFFPKKTPIWGEFPTNIFSFSKRGFLPLLRFPFGSPQIGGEGGRKTSLGAPKELNKGEEDKFFSPKIVLEKNIWKALIGGGTVVKKGGFQHRGEGDDVVKNTP